MESLHSFSSQTRGRVTGAPAGIWEAKIVWHGYDVSLGVFATEEEVHFARCSTTPKTHARI